MDGPLLKILRQASRSSLGTLLLILVLLLMMILPVPTFMLDMLFTFNIALSLIVLLTCIYISRPLDFNVFPTIILMATLLRLSLNVASTRVVLLNGHLGPSSAGEVIRAFGEIVIGGNFTVGFVVFAILTVINFVVVTKGAGRISEVSARFTLDAMPGKQMAIDADLNAGIITREEAKQSRKEIAQEADFYGSMDGASKFVRGDAVAGILILFVNLVGGMKIGMADYGLSFGQALQNYALLVIGDGLVAQIPALLLSSAAAVIVTRVNNSQDMAKQVISQLFQNPRPLVLTASLIGLLALIPGMPHLVFLILAGAAGLTAYLIKQRNLAKMTAVAAGPDLAPKTTPMAEKEIGWHDVAPVDILALEVGYRLINLVGVKKDGPLIARIKGVRKKLSQDLGFLIPIIHISDNLTLEPTHYRITSLGVTYAEATVFPDQHLAINPGQVAGVLEGIPTHDPAFGLAAYWISLKQRDHALSLGYTVVDASTVIATHISQIINDHAAELLGHEEVQHLLTRLGETTPKLVEALLTHSGLSLSVIVKVLQKLLRSHVPIIDVRTIAEALVEASVKTKDPDTLNEIVRSALRRLIVQRIFGLILILPVLILDPDLEQLLLRSLQSANDSQTGESTRLIMEPQLAENILRDLRDYEQTKNVEGNPLTVVVAPNLRAPFEKFIQNSIPGISILSYQEIPDENQIKVVYIIGKR